MRARELKIRRPKPGEREAFDGAFCLRPPGNPAGFQAESFLPVDKPQFVNGLGGKRPAFRLFLILPGSPPAFIVPYSVFLLFWRLPVYAPFIPRVERDCGESFRIPF